MWALPVLTALAPPDRKKPQTRGQRTHKTTIDWVRQLALQVQHWAPDRPIILVLDGGFASVALAAACRRPNLALVCRLKINAALYDMPIDPPPGRRGRKPTKGTRQLSPQQQAAQPNAEWQEVEVRWYGGRLKAMRMLSGMGLWHAAALEPLPLNYLVVRDPEGQQRDAAYFSTSGRRPSSRPFPSGTGPKSSDRTWSNERCVSGLVSGEGLIWGVRDPIFRREKIKGKSGPGCYEEVDPGVEVLSAQRWGDDPEPGTDIPQTGGPRSPGGRMTAGSGGFVW